MLMISENPFANQNGKNPQWLGRFTDKISIKGQNECWEWNGAIKENKAKKNYGVFNINGKQRLAHRVAYELIYGEIPPDKPHIMHSCHNPRCVNFQHLRAGTHADNMKDKVRAGRASKMVGSSHPNALLTEEQVRQIKILWAEGELSGQQIGDRFGVSLHAVSAIVTGKQWKHVTVDVENKRKDPIVPNKPPCPHCGSSNVCSHAIRKTKLGNKRVFRCRSCDRIFTPLSQS